MSERQPDYRLSGGDHDEPSLTEGGFHVVEPEDAESRECHRYESGGHQRSPAGYCFVIGVAT